MLIEQFAEFLRERGIERGSGVPCSFFTPLVNFMESDPRMDYLPASSEGEAVAIAAGLVTAGKPAFALMQNSGLGNAVNPITSMIYIYQMPVLFLVSQRGQPGLDDEPQHELMGVITEDLIKLCGIRCHVLREEEFKSQLVDAQRVREPLAFVCQQGTLEGGPKAQKRILEINLTIAQGSATQGHLVAKMTREGALESILPILNGEVGALPATVATTGKLSRELYELDDREHDKKNRFYMVGSMGCALGFGLGVARGKPKQKVLVLDGDGAILMKLGSLATVGMSGHENLHHVVFDNGVHDTTGGQRTASATCDLAQMALAAGYRTADTVASEAELVRTLTQQLARPGPSFLRVLIKSGARADLGRPKLSPKGVYQRFSAFLAESP